MKRILVKIILLANFATASAEENFKVDESQIDFGDETTEIGKANLDIRNLSDKLDSLESEIKSLNKKLDILLNDQARSSSPTESSEDRSPKKSESFNTETNKSNSESEKSLSKSSKSDSSKSTLQYENLVSNFKDLNSFKGKEKDNEIEALRKNINNFIKTYPKNNKITNAYFWLGETYRLQNDQVNAAINYLKVYTAYKSNKNLANNKIAESLYNLILSLHGLEEKGNSSSRKNTCKMVEEFIKEPIPGKANFILKVKKLSSKLKCAIE